PDHGQLTTSSSAVVRKPWRVAGRAGEYRPRGIRQPKRAQLAARQDAKMPAGEALRDQLVELRFAVVFAEDDADAVEQRGVAQDRELALLAIELEEVDAVQAVLLQDLLQRDRLDRPQVGPVRLGHDRVCLC